MEMIQRLVELKTGVWVPARDIIAWHPRALREENEENTFILGI